MTSSLSPGALRLGLAAVTLGLGASGWYLYRSLRRRNKMRRAVDGLEFVERAILEHAVKNGKPGDPVSVCDSIDDFCYNVNWAMNVGDKKAAVVEKVIREKKPRSVLELGGYVGYSALKFGNAQRESVEPAESPLYISVEIDPLMAAISSKLLEHAGLSNSVKVVIGTLNAAQDRIKEHAAKHTGANPGTAVQFDMIFIDHAKDWYVPDLLKLEELGFIGKGTTVVADNIIWPGAPEYLKLMTEGNKKEEYESELIKGTVEYSDIEDALLVSVKK